MADNGFVSLQINVELQQSSNEKAPRSVAYVFTSTGRFLSSAAVGENASTLLNIPAVASARDIRIVVGPESSEDKPVTLSTLTRRGATSQLLRVEPGERLTPVSFVIPSETWRCWLRFCVVRGTLLKRVITGGLPVDLPVCGAQVQIWSVEPIEFILPKLPISILEKLRRTILDLALARTPIVPVHPNPPDPAPSLSRLTFAQPVSTVMAAPTASAEFASLQVLAQTTDIESFRQALVPYIPILRVWLCELIPLFITKTLVGTVTTDRCGNFEDFIFLSCVAQHPNLYFTASVHFIDLQFSIYAPTPVACYTHWDYQCGTDVTLYTDSYFAPGCAPCLNVNAPENFVLFRAIGGIDLNSIYGATSTAVLPATPLGLTPGAVTAGEDSPFGGLLLPRVEFDSSILENGLAMYYRISYFDVVNGWVTLVGDIYRHYNEFVGGQVLTKPFLLGPQPSAPQPNLFLIPPALPPGGGDWAYPNVDFDLANAQFPTNSLPNATADGTFGLTRLKLDLFDASGNPVDIAAAGIAYYVPSTIESDGTIDTVDASTIGLVSGDSFILSLYLDNRPTKAELPAVSTSVNSTTSDPCGILHFNGPSDTVDIEYVAYQPGDFLDWSLDVVRGTSGSVASDAGNVSAGSPGMPDDFDNPVSVLNRPLLPATVGCTQAAFGVNLNVTSRCTDGWNQIEAYDSSASIAFALTIPCDQGE